MGKPYFLGILEGIKSWPEGRDFGTVPEKVACAREAPPYELPENKRGYGSWELTKLAFWLLLSSAVPVAFLLPHEGPGSGQGPGRGHIQAS